MITITTPAPREIKVVGRISNETYQWAIEVVQTPTTKNSPHFTGCNSNAEVLAIVEHARWIIDRVKDGTLDLPPLE